MPAVGAISADEINKLHDPVFSELQGALDKAVGQPVTLSEPLVDALRKYTGAILELVAAKDIPDRKNPQQQARQNIECKDRACVDAMQEVRQAAEPLKTQFEGATVQINQSINYYLREINRRSGAEMSAGASLY